ncbi:MAG TPA: DUF1801 domain-containing protein [Anaerolineales bacterium]|nr:DUF1801 domain-containing protein [Anaerolineales bacterium]
MNTTRTQENSSASQLITDRIGELADWRGELFARLRKLVQEAAPGIVEEWKWGTAVWTLNGLVCSVAAMKDHVKLNFFKGASLADPKGLFNNGLDAKATRSIDFYLGNAIDEPGVKELIRAAAALNTAAGKKK